MKKYFKNLIIFNFIFLLLIGIFLPQTSQGAGEGSSCTNNAECDPGLACLNKICPVVACLGEKVCSISSSDTIPSAQKSGAKWKNPTDNLQIKIPGLSFSSVNCASGEICQVPWIGEYINAIYRYAIGIVGIVSAAIIMWGGFQWIIAAGNPQKITEARTWIVSAILGLFLAMSSWLILHQINPDLVKIGIINITPVDEFTSGGGELGLGGIAPAAKPLNAANINKTYSECISQYGSTFQSASNKLNCNLNLLQALPIVESNCNPSVTSSKGAQGLIQLMPETFKSNGGRDPYNGEDNINAACSYLNKLTTTCCNGKSSDTNTGCNCTDNKYLEAAYNGGPKANSYSERCKGGTQWQCQTGCDKTKSSLYCNETYNYVKKVSAVIDTINP